jgi:hypothetical protein
MEASTSKCMVRKVLVEVLEAHPPLRAVPSRKILSDGRTISVRYENGHVIRYEDGTQYLVIHHHGGDITFVATNGWHVVEAVSRKDGRLQGIDELPDWALEMITEITGSTSMQRS